MQSTNFWNLVLASVSFRDYVVLVFLVFLVPAKVWYKVCFGFLVFLVPANVLAMYYAKMLAGTTKPTWLLQV